MPRYHFPGHPAFLDIAAAEFDRPEAALAARRDLTLAAVATLCSQAAEGDASHVVGILAKAEELTDRLRSAVRAAELMLIHVRSGRASVPEGSNLPLIPMRSLLTGRPSRRTT